MTTMSDKQHHTQVEPKQPTPKVDESGHLNIDDFVKIFDPNSQQVLVEQRN
jgi:hypothetical protein